MTSKSDDAITLLEQFVSRVEGGWPLWGGEHVLTQMYFLTSTDRHGKPLSFTHVGRVEALSDALQHFRQAFGLARRSDPAGEAADRQVACTHGCNSSIMNASNGRAGSLSSWRARLASQVARRGLLASRPDLVRRVCLIYRQDYACLGYPLPPACKE